MSRRHYSQQPQDEGIHWGRKARGFAARFACGSVIGMVGSVLHTRRLPPGPQAVQAALFMGTVLAVGGAIRTEKPNKRERRRRPWRIRVF